ncbi:hypothetical protein M1394_00835 [Candidatus Marsarchaeota archaeon]|nr:hypothetical protein [Candidatus Marsarchaeota archaeon]
MNTGRKVTSELRAAAESISRQFGITISLSDPYHEKFINAFAERSLALSGRLSNLVSVIVGCNVTGIIAFFQSNSGDGSVLLAERDRITGKRYLHKITVNSEMILFVDMLEMAEKRD